MNWLLVLWPMFAAACITLAVVYAIGLAPQPPGMGQSVLRAHGARVGTSSRSANWVCCWRRHRPSSPRSAAGGTCPIWLVIISVVGFVHTYLGSGRSWLAWSVVGTRTLALILNFIVGQNLNHLEVTGLRFIPFLGQSVPVAEAVRNPWMLIGQFSTVLLLVYVADASLAAARRGDRRKAWMVGGSILLFLSSSLVETFLVNWGSFVRPS
jgi:hypothetical protein